MKPEEVNRAMGYLRQAWQYVELPRAQVTQYERLYSAYPYATALNVIDDLIRVGCPRPGPAEMGDLLRTKLGAPNPNAPYKQSPGPFIEDYWDGVVPAEEPGWKEAAAEAKARLGR